MGNDKKNPTTFSWNNSGSFSVGLSNSSTDANFKNTYMVIGDFNGDGLSDIFTRVNNNTLDLNYKIYINNGQTFNSPITGTFLLPENASPSNKRIMKYEVEILMVMVMTILLLNGPIALFIPLICI